MWVKHAKLFVIVVVVSVCVCAGNSRGAVMSPSPGLDKAVRLVLGPLRYTAQYNYVMTGKVRLLLPWLSAEDVGGGYIRRGVAESDPSAHFIQVLFGSDPSKAPRHINHWGAATEASSTTFSALFGFMKSVKTGSVGAAESEIRRQEDNGQHMFEGIVSYIDSESALSRVVPLSSDNNFNLRQLPQATQLVAQRVNAVSGLRTLTAFERKCTASRGFLQAVDELSQQALSNPAEGRSLCYIYNARNYTLTLRKRSTVKTESVDVDLKNGDKVVRNYSDLVSTEFSVLNHSSGETTDFELLLATSGQLRGIPVRIVYQPNFWFKVVLDLESSQ